jgi:hypothetical protein
MLHFLVTAHYFITAHAVAKRTQKVQSYGFCEHVYRRIRWICSDFVIQLTRGAAKATVIWGSLKMSTAPQILLFIILIMLQSTV